MTTAQDGGKVVSLTHRPPLPPGNASYVLHAAAHLPHDVSYCVNNKDHGVPHCTVSPTLSRYVPQQYVSKHLISHKYSSNILLHEPQTQVLRPVSEDSEDGVLQ